MSGGGGSSSRNKRLEELQEQVLEQEIEDRQTLEEELESRKRLRAAGGLTKQTRFATGQRFSGVSKQSGRTRTTAPERPKTVAPRQSRPRDRGGISGGGRGGQGGAAGGGSGGGSGADSGGGGMGCFLPGTAVLLANGDDQPIESVRCGDEVASFDAQGRSVKGTVIGVHTFLRDDGHHSIRTADGKNLLVTKAHRLMTPGGWKEAGEFEIGDMLVDADGGGSEVQTTSWFPGAVFVHNLTVRGNPHYIANGIRVHNIKHEGGIVKGPEVAGDVVDVLQEGEFVMSRDAVKAIGKKKLELMNRRKRLPRQRNA